MSALAWLFGLGVLTVAFPFLFHLIRRTPKGQTQFSSLMFLKPTPPTLTRRSRLENILLLLMRAAAIALIAFAFMRPFFRGASSLSEFEVANRRVAILVDTSASMQRSGLWEQAKENIEKVLANLEQGDDVALLSFDSSVETIVAFDEDSEANMNPAGIIRDAVETIEPTWARSDLGKAMVTVADRLDVWRDSQRAKDNGKTAKLQIVVISDLQKGSDIQSLQSYQWPGHVYVQFLPVTPKSFSNATVQLLDRIPEEDDPAFRIRVVNSTESTLEQFSVTWKNQAARESEAPISFYVPPGTSRVLKVAPEQAIGAQQFVVTGDEEDFDNTFFVVPTEQQKLEIAYLGDENENDPEGMLYYLKRALVDTASRSVSVKQFAADRFVFDKESPPTLLVVPAAIEQDEQAEIDLFLNSGGTLLVACRDQATVESTSQWTLALPMGSDEDASEKPRQRKALDYSMLADIKFADPLFQPFSNPRFNDFTRIRFWKYQSVEFEDEATVNVVARFDNEDPAIWRRETERGGKVYAFASGWNPGDSQLARSTKFLPLVKVLIEIAAELPQLNQSLIVGQAIEFPAAELDFQKRVLIKPDGSRHPVEQTQSRFDNVDLPGIYRLASATGTQKAGVAKTEKAETEKEDGNASGKAELYLASFAVNVDRSESQTEAIPVEKIEMFEVKVGEQETASSELSQMREMRDREIEGQQKVWKWLIVAALLLLIGETWLAGRTATKMIAAPSLQSSSGIGEVA
ncbi:MAG: VWA domain-containing protein [Mariniblastus sp.]